jgi:ABC-type glutathione transport system ATPase component
MTLLEVAHVSKTYEAQSRFWRREAPHPAVNDVSFSVPQGKTLGIVGESGSGKSTLLRMILRLLRPSRGKILYRGQDIWSINGQTLLKLRREVQPIFQDPASSFNPRQKIGAILSAPLEVHRLGDRQSREAKVIATLTQMALPADFVRRYPHQLSGGQRQRVAIARAIILGPSLVLADEPTSALDVSVQAQILNVFRETKEKLGLTMVFVSHNLAVIRYVSDHVAVMRQGEIVEAGESEEIFSNPTHPYTQALLQAVPDPKRRRGRPAASRSSIHA